MSDVRYHCEETNGLIPLFSRFRRVLGPVSCSRCVRQLGLQVNRRPTTNFPAMHRLGRTFSAVSVRGRMSRLVTAMQNGGKRKREKR